MSVAEQLGQFLTATSTADLPSEAMEHAEMVIASTIASAAYGARIESARIIRELARERGGSEDATLWFDAGPRLPLAEAAQANAVTSDAAASDDSDLRNIVHAGTPLTAASLAIAERNGDDGEAVLTAIVLGYEAAGRISSAMTPEFRDRGFHGCHGAVFASAVAAGRLLRLDAQQMAHTIALSATSIGGLIIAAETSTAREYHGGLATLLGVNAALAAQRGYQADLSVLESKKGFFEALSGLDGEMAGEHATGDLGQSWDIVTDLAIKLAPGAHSYHAIAEAAVNASRDGDIAVSDVEAIFIWYPSMTGVPGPLHPTDLVTMAHSPAYFAAAGVADREFSWAHASAAKIVDPVIHALIDRVQAGPVPSAAETARYRQGATVSIRTLDGKLSSSTVYMPRGSGPLGIDWSDIDAKYRSLLATGELSDRMVDASLSLIHGFREVTNVSALTELLHTDTA